MVGNDWDNDGDDIYNSATLDTGPTNGTLTYFNPDGSFEYVPNAAWVGTDSFTYHVNDGLVDSNIATVTIDVTNQAPVANDDYYSTLHDQTITEFAPGVVGNDWDNDGDDIYNSATLDTGPTNGTLTYFNPDGSFEYVPNTHWTGTDTFTYHVNDGLVDSNIATVTIDVTNQAPVANDDFYSTLHDQTITEFAPGVVGNDWDNDGDDIYNSATLDTGPTNGTLTYFNPDGSFEYVPNAAWVGTDSFTYHVNDGLVDSNIATVTIDVTNQAPVANDDYYSTLHDQTITEFAPGVVGNDWDNDGDDIYNSATLDTGPTNGTLTYFNPDGSFEYVPNAAWVGTDSFTYHVNDGLADSNIATVTIDVTNQAPSAVINGNSTLMIGEALHLDASSSYDPDGDPLTFAWDLNGDGQVDYSSESGDLDWTVLAGLNWHVNTTQTATLVVTDSFGAADSTTLNIDVLPLPDGTITFSYPFEDADPLIKISEGITSDAEPAEVTAGFVQLASMNVEVLLPPIVSPSEFVLQFDVPAGVHVWLDSGRSSEITPGYQLFLASLDTNIEIFVEAPDAGTYEITRLSSRCAQRRRGAEKAGSTSP